MDFEEYRDTVPFVFLVNLNLRIGGSWVQI
jgi:hypothetical protein